MSIERRDEGNWKTISTHVEPCSPVNSNGEEWPNRSSVQHRSSVGEGAVAERHWLVHLVERKPPLKTTEKERDSLRADTSDCTLTFLGCNIVGTCCIRRVLS